MGTQDAKEVLETQHRESEFPAGGDTKQHISQETQPETNLENQDKIQPGDKTAKSDGKEKKKKKKPKKSKKSKRRPVSSDSSSIESSSEEESDDSDSEESTDSDVRTIKHLKKRRAQKKRQPPMKGHKGSLKPKKSKKQVKHRDASSTDSSTSDSDSDAQPDTQTRLDQIAKDIKRVETMNQDFLAHSRQYLQLALLQQQAVGQQNNGPALQPGLIGIGASASGSPGYGGPANFGVGGPANFGVGGPATFGANGRQLIPGGVLPSKGDRASRNNDGSEGLGTDDDDSRSDADSQSDEDLDKQSKSKRKTGRGNAGPLLEYRRVDQVWDNKIHNYRLKPTSEKNADSHLDSYIFHVRRVIGWDGQYKCTVVDVKSKALREVLRDVIGTPEGISLVEDSPKINPNMLFLYLDDFKEHRARLKEFVPGGKKHKERKKARRWTETKINHLKVLLKYLNKDYAEAKKSLFPMLENGLITFEYLWALWKPGTLAFATTYGSADHPRVFKVDRAESHSSMFKGQFYHVAGKYLDFDGKQFGLGSMAEEIPEFSGSRKITSLETYPLKYHKEEASLRTELIERGKKFVSLSGVNYKSHHGMAFIKKKKGQVMRVNVNGRIMIDASTHRRINPNYSNPMVRPRNPDSAASDSEGSGCCGDSDDEGSSQGLKNLVMVTKVFKDSKGNVRTMKVPQVVTKSDREAAEKKEAKTDLDEMKTQDEDKAKPGDAEGGEANIVSALSDDDYLIASPVVLGFAFEEKMWLEFSVSGVKEIVWNENAYDSLVLEPNTKAIVKALVESHKYHAAESIDDVIQGKGRGLVAVLHGPPGTGKTLTAEGISELLKCPLYMVSAGDLGTDSRYLESELERILDICHTWGAILLLDEADVFLEKRDMHDIHRNALVSIFLRQLEYFQGILFLTTNRVETFDEAFQSRIHIALRYDELEFKAKKAIFKIFVERVRQLEKAEEEKRRNGQVKNPSDTPASSVTPQEGSSGTSAADVEEGEKGAEEVVSSTKVAPFSEEDFDTLARQSLNGRQIKNTVRTAQALAVNNREPLSMHHIREVLEVYKRFERDLKGGPGYENAMRSYF